MAAAFSTIGLASFPEDITMLLWQIGLVSTDFV
jgi:hypothetical protein